MPPTSEAGELDTEPLRFLHPAAALVVCDRLDIYGPRDDNGEATVPSQVAEVEPLAWLGHVLRVGVLRARAESLGDGGAARVEYGQILRSGQIPRPI
jgi:hypothetical protein